MQEDGARSVELKWKRKKRKWKSKMVKGGRDGAVWSGQVETQTGLDWEGAQRDWMTGEGWGRYSRGGGVSSPSEGQAPACWFRPHGPSRRWEYQTLWLPKTHRVLLELWTRTESPLSFSGPAGFCVSVLTNLWNLQSNFSPSGQINTSHVSSHPLTCWHALATAGQDTMFNPRATWKYLLWFSDFLRRQSPGKPLYAERRRYFLLF